MQQDPRQSQRQVRRVLLGLVLLYALLIVALLLLPRCS